jgi:hypothetical protein
MTNGLRSSAIRKKGNGFAKYGYLVHRNGGGYAARLLRNGMIEV